MANTYPDYLTEYERLIREARGNSSSSSARRPASSQPPMQQIPRRTVNAYSPDVLKKISNMYRAHRGWSWDTEYMDAVRVDLDAFKAMPEKKENEYGEIHP